MLKIDGVTVRYGDVLALDNVSLELGDHSFVGLLGANGAGKSTLLRTISGLHRPASGKVTFRDVAIADVAPHKIPAMGVAHVPEGRRVFASMSVLDNLLMGNFPHRGGISERQLLDNVFDLFPRMAERRAQLAGSMSGGEQQMLAIARALMLQPELLMLDEPSLGLAPVIVEEVFERLARIHRETGIAVLLVEQNAVQALEVIGSALILETGRAAFSGTRQELEGTDYIRNAYLGL